MDIADMILVSVDDHVVEPATMFDAHLPAAYKDRAPFVRHTPELGDHWVFGEQVAPNVGLNAVAGCPPEEYGIEPTEWGQMRPGCHDVEQRIADMSAGGVLAGLNFPSFGGFAGQLFMREPDKDLALTVLRAYNDWSIDEWAGSHPDRFIPMSLPALWDPQACAAEIERVAAKGCHAMTFSENPSKLGLPSFHTDHWDPIFAAAADNELVLCLHIGSSSSMPITAPDAPPDVPIALTPTNSQMAVADIVFSGIFRRFPQLQVAMSEGGVGWIPYLLERLDYVYQHHHAWTGLDLGGRLPSQVFRDHIWTCFIDDKAGIKLREDVGLDRMMWEMDYPHSDTTWPTAPEMLMKSFDAVAGGVPDEHVDKITHLNAMRCFSFDPFEHRARERCTVGALRAEATGHDVSVKSMGRRKAEADAAAISRRLTAAASRDAG